jgi:hypothetical protein
MKSKRKALFVAANYWDTPYRVGSHELASLFAEHDWEVGFLSDPVSPFHLFMISNTQVRDRFRIWAAGGKQDKSINLWNYVPLTIFPVQKYLFMKSRFTYNYWHKFTLPNVFHKLKTAGFDKVDFLYFDNPAQGIWADVIDYSRSAFRIADNYSGYEKYAGYAKVMQERLAKKVDLVLYTAKNFEDYIKSIYPQNSLYFPNGVNFDRFANGCKEEPEDLKLIPHPRIAYIGEMEIRFDFDLIKYAAKALPGYSFILIGNDTIARMELHEFNNIHLLGIKGKDELAAYLHNSDAGIIPFNVKRHSELIKYVNPIKLHQYLACGLPVVSARWDELERMKTKAFLYDTYAEFVQLLKRSVENNVNKNELIEAARSNDWKIRYKELIRALGF